MPPIRVAVSGASGRMGSTVCAAVEQAEGLDLVGALDPGGAGQALAGIGRPDLVMVDDLDALGVAAPDVVVDFTVAAAAMPTLRWCAGAGVHAVVGTSGLGPDDLAELATAFAPERDVGCVIAPNFAIGALLLVRLAAQAARWFDTAEIVELHHDAKRDAPSGTALHTAERLAAARHDAGAGDWGADPTTDTVLEGARGGLGPAGVRIHSVRLRGLVAHEEILLGTTGQTLTLRHDSYDRSSFMPGVLAAVRAIGGRPGLTVGLDELLDL